MLRDRPAESGNVILELALVLPLLLFVIGAGIELNRVLRAAEMAALLSREGGSIAYRLCGDFREPGPSGTEAAANTRSRTADCMNKVLNDSQQGLQAFAANVMPGARIVISVYRYDSTPGSLKLWRVAAAGEDSAHGIISKFGTNRAGTTLVGPATVTKSTASAHERIVISEAFVPYEPILRLLPRTLFSEARVIYEPSIF